VTELMGSVRAAAEFGAFPGAVMADCVVAQPADGEAACEARSA